MISYKNYTTHDLRGMDVRCLSTDKKPTSGIPNGAICIEIDTGKGYLFDEDNEKWWEIPAGSSVVINPAAGVSF